MLGDSRPFSVHPQRKRLLRAGLGLKMQFYYTKSLSTAPFEVKKTSPGPQIENSILHYF